MTVPGRVAAAALLLSLDPKPRFVRHACAVAEVAGWLALRVDQQGLPIDRRLAESAALLHDADKVLGPGDPARGLPHGEGSATWLTRTGHPELAPAVANHPVGRLANRDFFLEWMATAGIEAKVVAYADKRARQRLVSLDDRFETWTRRYAGRWADEPPGMVRAHAAQLESEVCTLAGVSPGAVRRLRWTARAVEAARKAAHQAAATVRAS